MVNKIKNNNHIWLLFLFKLYKTMIYDINLKKLPVLIYNFVDSYKVEYYGQILIDVAIL